jgi:hypothetical protein
VNNASVKKKSRNGKEDEQSTTGRHQKAPGEEEEDGSEAEGGKSLVSYRTLTAEEQLPPAGGRICR